jgi:hypothetical protein
MWEEQFYNLSTAAAQQEGLITAAQAGRIGVDGETLGRFRDVGLIYSLDWDVHQLVSSPTAPMYAYPYAAWLAISPEQFRWERPDAPVDDAVLSHESAARLYGIGSMSAAFLVFTAPRELPAPRVTTIHVSRLAPDEVVIREGVPVTTPHRTLVDLVRARMTDYEKIGRAIHHAVVKDLVDLRLLYDDLVPLAKECQFPTDGAKFLDYFLPNLSPKSLSLRNLRSYAVLMSPDRVGQTQHRVLQVFAEARRNPGSTEGQSGAGYEKLSWDVAAEIVGYVGWDE